MCVSIYRYICIRPTFLLVTELHAPFPASWLKAQPPARWRLQSSCQRLVFFEDWFDGKNKRFQ